MVRTRTIRKMMRRLGVQMDRSRARNPWKAVVVARDVATHHSLVWATFCRYLPMNAAARVARRRVVITRQHVQAVAGEPEQRPGDTLTYTPSAMSSTHCLSHVTWDPGSAFVRAPLDFAGLISRRARRIMPARAPKRQTRCGCRAYALIG